MLAENSDSPDARLEAQVTFHWLHSSGFGVVLSFNCSFDTYSHLGRESQ